MKRILTAFLIAAAASAPAASSELIYTLLPPAQAESLKRAKNGALLSPYDQAYFAWTTVEMSTEACRLASASERRNMELTWTVAFGYAVIEDPIASMKAQFNIKDRLIPLKGCNTEVGALLLRELINVLKSDNSAKILGTMEKILKPNTTPKRLF